MLGSFTDNPGLVPVLRTVPETKAVARAAMTALLAGPKGAELESRPAMYTSIPDGTRLLDITIAGRRRDREPVARVRSAADATVQGGTAAAQVVYTLTQFPTVDKVRIEVDGESRAVGPVGRSDFQVQGILPAIFVDRPAWGAAAGNPVAMSGIANVFEAQFRVQILDADGSLLADEPVTATCGTGCWGSFRTSVPYTVDEGPVRHAAGLRAVGQGRVTDQRHRVPGLADAVTAVRRGSAGDLAGRPQPGDQRVHAEAEGVIDVAAEPEGARTLHAREAVHERRQHARGREGIVGANERRGGLDDGSGGLRRDLQRRTRARAEVGEQDRCGAGGPMGERPVRVGQGGDPCLRIRFAARCAGEHPAQLPGGVGGHGLEERVPVPHVLVQGRWTHANPLGDGGHRHGLQPLLFEQRPRGGDDLRAGRPGRRRAHRPILPRCVSPNAVGYLRPYPARRSIPLCPTSTAPASTSGDTPDAAPAPRTSRPVAWLCARL